MISKDKTYTTLRGMPVRIYATDAGGLFPVHGAIFNDGMWNGMKWTEEGKTHFTTTSCMVNTVDDLAEVKPRIKRTFWTNIYGGKYFDPDKVGQAIFFSKEMADKFVIYADRVACVKVEIDVEEGEGL
jgi:hypothetical protein